MTKKSHTPISQLGEFGLVDRLTAPFTPSNPSTIKAVGDDAAVIDAGDRYLLLSTDQLLEGIDFDLTYFPLAHLGYKTVVVGISDILAMNGRPTQLTLSLGISARFSVEMLEEFYQGVKTACGEYGVDLVGGDTSASVNGLLIGVSVVGEVSKEKIVYRSGAQTNDLICVTGALGGAYMGLHLLEREKRALDGHPNPNPDFSGHEYILERQLKPMARVDILVRFAEAGILPTSMIDISDGLASELLHLCKASDRGVRIFLERIPIAKQTMAMAEELRSDPVVAALNGGDDYELLFTVPIQYKDQLFAMGLDVIGFVSEAGTGALMLTPDEKEVQLTAPGWIAAAV